MNKQTLYQGILTESELKFITEILQEAAVEGNVQAAEVLARIDFKFSEPLKY